MNEELFVQNISLDKITLRMLMTIVEFNKLTKFRFYDCRISKNGINVFTTMFSKVDKPNLSIEISFNPVHDPKAFVPLFNDKFSSIILRCNELDVEFAKEVKQSLKSLIKLD